MQKIDVPVSMVTAHTEAMERGRAELAEAIKARGDDPAAFFFDMGDSHQLVDHGDGKAELTLYGSIGGYFGIDGKAAAKDIRALDGVDELDVRLDSGGGSVFDAILIYNALVDADATVTVTVDSLAASAASFLLQAGDERIMNRGAMAMVHAPWLAAVGTSTTMRAAADFLDKNTDNMVSIYSARSGRDGDHWRQYLDGVEDHWMTADEAVTAGLADSIVVDSTRETEEEDDGDDGGQQASVGALIVTSSKSPDSDQATATAVDPAERQRRLEAADARIEAARLRAELTP